MAYGMIHHRIFNNNRKTLSRRFGCCRLFDHYSESMTRLCPLYLACDNNDLDGVESCLKKMKMTEIDVQYPPNNETVLHVATRKQHKEIVEMLLHYGVQRTLRNIDGQQAYELAETEEMKDLFKRLEFFRFAFSLNYCAKMTFSESKSNCKSCSLVNSNTMYEWELIDQNAAEKALEFRRTFKANHLINSKIWKKKLYSLKKRYLTVHEQDLPENTREFIRNCFKNALGEVNPNHLVRAYTSCQTFSTFVNIDMARNVMHNLKNGCSQFSCQCLYSTEDGTKSIANIFLHHPNFDQHSFQGEVYRGVVMEKEKLDHYQVGSRIITTTFLSTSKDPAVAQMFGDKRVSNSTMHSFFCTYKLISDRRTAIDISPFSSYCHENEVLILPYSSFLIAKIEEEQERTKIYLEEQ